MPDTLEDVKRAQEVTDRPKPSVSLPPGLRHEFSDASYKMAAPKKPAVTPKSDLQKSLDWNAQQRKVAEAQ